MPTSWRKYYAPIISKIIMDNKHLPKKEIKKILCQSNPGEYGHMKKIWANEYMRQINHLFSPDGNLLF